MNDAHIQKDVGVFALLPFCRLLCIMDEKFLERNIYMKRTIACLLLLVTCLTLAIPANAQPQPSVTVEKEVLLASLYEADISSVRRAISLKLITCEELTAYYLDRIEAYDDPYNCFITLCDDALEEARERDEQLAQGDADGLLFGIPVVIKDNMDLEGYHTTNGYKKKDEQIAESNADVVQYLLDEGAVIIGKTNMSTAAQDALRSLSAAAGETKNAYSTYMAAGGSSGGTAVSVSLNFAMAGLGTDTNSSLRIPAALAGCVSLRPTFGLLSREGIKKLNGTRDTAGAITRTVYDQAIMLDVLTQGAYEYAKNLDVNAVKGMRIGILKQLSYATGSSGLRSEKNIDEEVATAFEQAIEQLRACGAEVVEVSMPKIFNLSEPTLKSNKASLKEALYEEFRDLLETEEISTVIFPTYLSSPIRSGKDAEGKVWDVYAQTNINNCRTLSPSASVPEISVPIGVHSLGAGIGMEIAADKEQEQLLLNIAYAFTQQEDLRVVPDGAENEYLSAVWGTLDEVIDDYLYRLEESTRPTETTTAPTTQPQVIQVQAEPESADPILLICVVCLLAAGVFLVIFVLVILGSRRRTKPRRRPPVVALSDDKDEN